LVFAAPLLLFVYLIEKIPSPDDKDIAYRTARVPMLAQDRKNFIRIFLPGLIACILIYAFATIFRDMRDNFSAEMWKEMGFFDKPELFAKTETPITIIILLLIGSMVMIKDSFKALMLSHFFIGLGFIIAGFSSYLFTNQNIPPIWWMTLVGLGLYMVYIPFNSVFFDRLIAAFKHTGNVGFLIYLADSFGYVGSVGVMLSKEIFKVQLNWVTFFSNSVIWLSLVGLALTIFSSVYFYAKYRNLVLK
jgi:hypothetical protein